MRLYLHRSAIAKSTAIALLGISMVAFILLCERGARRDYQVEHGTADPHSPIRSKRRENMRNSDRKGQIAALKSRIPGGRDFRRNALKDCFHWMETQPDEAIETIYLNRQIIDNSNLFLVISELIQHNNDWIKLLSMPSDEKATWLRDLFVSQFFKEEQDEGDLKALIAISGDKSSSSIREKIIAGLRDGARHHLGSLEDPLNPIIWEAAGSEKMKMIEGLAEAISYERPKYVLSEMEKHSLKLSRTGMERLATGFGQSNLNDGLLWLLNSDNGLSGYSKKELSEKMVYEAMRHDSIASSRIVGKIQSPELRDDAVCGIVSYLISIQNLDDAEKWASSTMDSRIRDDLMIKIADVKALNGGTR